jgi:hypothetical protein
MAAGGSTFSGWSGPDGAECAAGTVLMTADKSCTATFSLAGIPNFDQLVKGTKTVKINGGTLIRIRLLAEVELAKLAYKAGYYRVSTAALKSYIVLVRNSSPQSIVTSDASRLIALATTILNQIGEGAYHSR